MLRASVFDLVAEGQYRYFPGRVFQLASAYRLFLVGRLYSEDVEDVLRAAAERWSTLLGSWIFTAFYELRTVRK